MKEDRSSTIRHAPRGSRVRFPAPRETFLEYVLDAVRTSGQEDRIRDPQAPDVLAHLDYETELAVKREAVRLFWKEHGLPVPLVPEIIPSPRPRHYRTTSKRRVVYARGKYRLEMGYGRAGSPGADGSLLEAELHGRLFRKIGELLNRSRASETAKALNFCILRGTYDEAALIFNVAKADGMIVRGLRAMAQELAGAEPALRSAFMMIDPSRSGYYLENSARTGKDRLFKKFFGPGVLVQELDGKRLFYPPEVFSQVNGSLCETFASVALGLLAPEPDARVVDLYCGYGLLTMKAAAKVSCVFGMDWEGPAVRAAESNAMHLFPGKNIRFAAAPVTEDSLKEHLPPQGGARREYIMLDPPRAGAAPGVAETLAARKPANIVHIFCGTDGMPHALKHWGANGYRIGEVRILDMFPGSANLETLVSLRHAGS